MASKQLGKLRQWAGEVISTRDKTIISDEFKDLERDIDLRRQGLQRLHITSEDYKHALSKKRDSEALPQEDKLLPVDALGVVMIQHGEEFGDESAFGSSLVNLGKAHCKIATLQESFAISLESTFIDSIKQNEDEIKEYQHQRKKLDSRRLSLDAAHSKAEKLRNSTKGSANNKKDRELKDAEEEYEEAKSRYEETMNDVRLRMTVIQENEINQLQSLTDLLCLEMNFIQQYMDVLRDVKDGWVDDNTMAELEQQHRQAKKPPPPPSVSRSSSTKINRSRSVISEPLSDEDMEDADDDKEKEKSGGFRARAKSFTRRKSDAGSKAGSRAPSRPQSRAERKRSDSNATAASKPGEDSDDEEKEKEKDKKEKSKRISVTGWASSTFSIGRSKKEKEKFSALMEDKDGAAEGHHTPTDSDSDDGARKRRSLSAVPPKISKSKSSPSTPTASPKISISTKLLQRSSSTQASPVAPSPRVSSSLQVSRDKPKSRVVVAMYDFTASSADEISFKAGDQIIVTNEVLDGWWMGELKNGAGKKGLFPSSYTRPLPEKEPSSGSLSSLSLSGTSGLQPSLGRRPEPLDLDTKYSDDESALEVSATIPMTVTSASRYGFGLNETHSVSDLEEDLHHPFGDQFVASGRTPLHQHRSRIGQERSEGDEQLSTDDEQDHLVSAPSAQDNLRDRIVHPHVAPPLPQRKLTDPTPKKAPPPPPPRRIVSNAPTPPPVPQRPNALHSRSSQSLSSGASSFVTVANTSTTNEDVGADGLTYSPFDSPKDNVFSTGCNNFRQNPFKPKGMCSNCFQMH